MLRFLKLALEHYRLLECSSFSSSSSSSLWSSSLPFLYLSRLLVFQAGASSTVAVVAFLVPSSSAHWHVQALPLFRHEMAITACLDANCFYLCTLCTLSACLHCLCLPQCLCLCVCKGWGWERVSGWMNERLNESKLLHRFPSRPAWEGKLLAQYY